MKLVCMTQVYNANTLRGHDGLTDVERFMRSVCKYVDGLIVFDDASTDGTRDTILSYQGISRLEDIDILGNKQNTPMQEGFHRARSLEHCRRMKADYVLSLDVDEVFQPKGERHIRELCRSLNGRVGSFRVCDLWRTDRYARIDGRWSHRIENRLWPLSKEIGFDITPGVRTSILPNGINPNNVSGSLLRIIHYGYSTTERIVQKYKRFQSLGVSLDDVIDESELRLTDVDPAWLPDKVYGPSTEVYSQFIKEILTCDS